MPTQSRFFLFQLPVGRRVAIPAALVDLEIICERYEEGASRLLLVTPLLVIVWRDDRIDVFRHPIFVMMRSSGVACYRCLLFFMRYIVSLRRQSA